MRSATFFIYILCLTQNGANGSGLDKLAPLSTPSPSKKTKEKTIPAILKEVISGPLKGRKVTMILEDGDLENSFLESNDMMNVLGEPVSLYRVSSKNISSQGVNEEVNNDINYLQLKNSVVIFVMNGQSDWWWPLWFPPKEWIVRVAILVSSSSSCLNMNYLLTPLMQMPSSVAMICPHLTHRAAFTRVPYRVWSWRPYNFEDQLVDLGIWNPNVFRSWNDLFIDRFQDMALKNMSILAQTSDRPFIYETDENVVKGLNYLIMDTLRQWLKFNLKYTTNRNLLWSSIFDSVQRGENDVLINYATITSERNDIFDLTVPYYREGWGVILEIPPPLPKWQNVIFPYTWPVWGATVLTLFCTALTYHLLYYHYEKSFVTNVIYITQSLLSNPMETLPTNWLARNFLLVWMFVSWLLNTFYTSNLIAVLTIPVFPHKLQTLKELAESDYLLCMVDIGEFVDEALAATTDPTLSTLNDKLLMVPTYDHMEHVGEEQCVERVVAGTHAHAETYSYIKILYQLTGHGSKVYSFQEQLYPGYLAFIAQKNTPWKYKFDDGMQWMFETGLMEKWYTDSMDDFKAYFRESHDSKIQALSLSHLQGPFLLYVLGLILSLSVIMGEVLYPDKATEVGNAFINV